MKLKLIGVLAAVLVLLMLAFTVAYAHGHSPEQLEQAGWTCIPIPFGDELWPHCFPPGSFPPAPGPSGNLPASIVVKVFGDGGHPFLGTEILIRADLYKGQPCPQDGGGPYHSLAEEGLPYFACHHFDTEEALAD